MEKEKLQLLGMGVGIFCLAYGAYTFPWGIDTGKPVTWSGFLSFFDLIVGVLIVAFFLGCWSSRKV